MIAIEREPVPSAAALGDALRAFAEAGRRRARPDDLDARDPAFIVRTLPLMSLLYDYVFRCETELSGEVPDEPLLAVANHSGMSGTPDLFCLMTAFWRRYGADMASYGLMHDVPFRAPVAGAWLNAAGAVAANPRNARAALDRGAKVLVFPGGDREACRPYRQRYQIVFSGRKGFLRTAIAAGVRILPVVSAGAHSSLYLWSDGQRIAEALNLSRPPMRSNVFPIGLAMPYGVICGLAWPHIPLPVKIHTRFLPPIDLGVPPSSANDPEVLDHCYGRVVATMQRGLDDLRRAGRHGLFPKKRRPSRSD